MAFFLLLRSCGSNILVLAFVALLCLSYIIYSLHIIYLKITIYSVLANLSVCSTSSICGKKSADLPLLNYFWIAYISAVYEVGDRIYKYQNTSSFVRLSACVWTKFEKDWLMNQSSWYDIIIIVIIIIFWVSKNASSGSWNRSTDWTIELYWMKLSVHFGFESIEICLKFY